MPIYQRGDVVLIDYPFLTAAGTQQKLRPALVVSDHTVSRRFPDDLMLAAITSQHLTNLTANELEIHASHPDFGGTGLRATSIVRLDFVMTVPASLVSRKIGKLPDTLMGKVDTCLKRSLGLK